MQVELIKLTAILVIFAVGMSGGLLSRRLSLGKSGENWLSGGNVFAGGVFLGAALIHVLPDSQAGFSESFPQISYPLFGLLCGLSVGLMLALEKCGHFLSSKKPDGVAEPTSATYPIVLFLILSIHSVITGFALGLEGTHAQALVLLIAVLAHKGAAAFALGVSLTQNSRPTDSFTSKIVLFSSMTPLGVILGWTISSLFSDGMENKFEAVFDAIAAGTFIFVAVFEILPGEFSKEKNLLNKIILLLMGYGLMALVAIWT